MRLMLASLVALAPLAAYAQTPPPASAPAAPAPAAAAPAATPPAAAATPPAATATTPPAAESTPPPPSVPPPPPPPPAPPTDPAAIAVLDALQNVCIPAVEGGALDKIAKANGFRNSSGTFVKGGPGFKLTIWPAGSNPNQCHLDIVSQVYPEGPEAPIVVALHNWSAVERQWDLYRNDVSVEGNQQLTTRSWEHDDTGKHEAMFITTYRHADGSPMGGKSDNATMVYSETKTGG